jgi:hypothetical protein
MSEWVALVIAMAAVCAVVVIIVVVRERRVGEDDDPSETPDVIEYMSMMIGVVYAIVIGLAIAGVWESRSSAQGDALREAQALREVSARAQVFPAEVRDRIKSDVDAYITYVVTVEKPYMEENAELSDRGQELLDTLRRDVAGRAPENELENQAYQPILDRIATADEARQSRGQSTGPTMPGIVWFGLVTGAVVTVGMIFTLQIRRSGKELLLAGVFSALMAFLLFLIWDFDDPFGRGIDTTMQPFTDLFPALKLD